MPEILEPRNATGRCLKEQVREGDEWRIRRENTTTVEEESKKGVERKKIQRRVVAQQRS
jgi:hypothetical protein